MKLLLILSAFCFCAPAFAQEHPDIPKLQRPFKLDFPKNRFIPGDSAGMYTMPQNRNVMPNVFIVLPPPKLAGNNGRGQDVYVLPLDNMPMIKPDSSYYSKMPLAGRRLN
jgi:hypothetical protein